MTARSVAFRAARESLPIAVGYFTVALAVGVLSAQVGLSAALIGLMSATNLSSSGQFAGLTLMSDGGTYLELAIGTLLINARYVLMALSLGHRLGPRVGVLGRAVVAAGITDEIYALSLTRRRVGVADYVGSMVLPILGWTAGSVLGNLLGETLPPLLTSAFGVLLYAMFVAIVVPVARESWAVLGVVVAAAALSSALMLTPLDTGWRIIVVTVVVAAAAASFAPVKPQADTASASEMTAERP